MKRHRLLAGVSIALLALGYFLPLWPLCAVGLVLLSLSGWWPYAVALGIALDLAWGVPPFAHWLVMPFALLALLSGALRWWGKRYLFDRSEMRI